MSALDEALLVVVLIGVDSQSTFAGSAIQHLERGIDQRPDPEQWITGGHEIGGLRIREQRKRALHQFENETDSNAKRGT